MIRNIIFAVTVLVLVGCEAREDSGMGVNVAVEESFKTLKTALREGDGQTAVDHVTTTTVDIYERCRKLALDSSGTDFEAIGQLEVLLAFQLRWLLDKKTLESMNGSEVFVWAVDEGMVDKETLESIELDKLQVEGNKAMATLFNKGQPVTDLVLNFELQENQWKLDLMRVFKAVEPVFDALREETGRTKIELAIYLIERTYNDVVPPQILNGPLK